MKEVISATFLNEEYTRETFLSLFPEKYLLVRHKGNRTFYHLLYCQIGSTHEPF